MLVQGMSSCLGSSVQSMGGLGLYCQSGRLGSSSSGFISLKDCPYVLQSQVQLATLGGYFTKEGLGLQFHRYESKSSLSLRRDWPFCRFQVWQAALGRIQSRSRRRPGPSRKCDESHLTHGRAEVLLTERDTEASSTTLSVVNHTQSGLSVSIENAKAFIQA